MNRRRFLEMLGMATAGSMVAYSFPSVIVPKNIVRVYTEPPSGPNFVDIEAFYRAQLASAQKWFENNAIAYNVLKTGQFVAKFTEGKRLVVT